MSFRIGLYRNAETGLLREFFSPPTRGSWALVKVLEKPLVSMQIGRLDGVVFVETEGEADGVRG